MFLNASKIEKTKNVAKSNKSKRNDRKRARERGLMIAKTTSTLVKTLLHKGALNLINFSCALFGSDFGGG